MQHNMHQLRHNDSFLSNHSNAKTPSAAGSPIPMECDADDERRSDCMSLTTTMSGDDMIELPRKLSVSIPERNTLYGARRPNLREILSNTASPPWTLAALMAYLSSNHCLETLEFTMDAGRYKKHYLKMMDKATASGVPPSEQELNNTRVLWQRLVDAYIRPNGSREVNIPSSVRDPILRLNTNEIFPIPDVLDRAIAKVYELMEESVLVPFLESVTPRPPTATSASQSPSLDGAFPEGMSDSSEQSYAHQQQQQQQRPSSELAAFSHSNRFFRNSTRGSTNRAVSPLVSSSSSSTSSTRRSPPETFTAVFSKHRFGSSHSTSTSNTPISAYPATSKAAWNERFPSATEMTDDSAGTVSAYVSPMTPISPASQRDSANWRNIKRWSGWRHSLKGHRSSPSQDSVAIS